MSRAKRSVDAERLFTLYDQHVARLYGLAIAMLGNAADAQDAILEALLNAWRELPPTDVDRESIHVWLVSLVHAEAIAIVRARARRCSALRDHEKPRVQSNG